jgi:ADP-heptose:LPS heptosyltransferase
VDIKVRMNSKGWGDTFLSLTASYGLKLKYPKDRVIFSTRNMGCAEIFPAAFDVLTHEWDETPAEKVYSPYDSYRLELWHGKKTRLQLYSELCENVTLTIPPHKQLHDTQFNGHIVLVPYTDSTNRNWLIQHWLALEQILMSRGFGCVVMSAAEDGLEKFVSQRVIQIPPIEVASIIENAHCVIAGDTGIMHLTGLLGTKGIVLTAGITGDRIYSLYPTVKVVNGGLECNNCRWVGTVSNLCSTICASLQLIHPKIIADMVPLR